MKAWGEAQINCIIQGSNLEEAERDLLPGKRFPREEIRKNERKKSLLFTSRALGSVKESMLAEGGKLQREGELKICLKREK